MKLHEEVWRKAVAELEHEVMRNCATLTGGKKANETVEIYAHRVKEAMDNAVARLTEARQELAKALKEKR